MANAIKSTVTRISWNGILYMPFWLILLWAHGGFFVRIGRNGNGSYEGWRCVPRFGGAKFHQVPGAPLLSMDPWLFDRDPYNVKDFRISVS